MQAETLLLVEDDMDLQNVEAFALGAAGYRVITARDGRAALERLAHERPMLILLDLHMRDVNGRQFMASFRAAYGTAIPVVVVTAAEDAQRQAADVAADGWLAKPFELCQLLAVVESHLRRKATARH
jgi:DNA-binding response OmpR family regulator